MNISNHITLNDVCSFIVHANDNEICDIMQAVYERYITSRPDRDVMYLALPKNNPDERNRLLQKVISSFEGECV